MRYSKMIVVTAVMLMVSMTIAYAGDKKANEKKACAKKCQAVKACADANAATKCAVKKAGDSQKKCAAKESNIKSDKQCKNPQAVASGEKKGWLSFLNKKETKAVKETKCCPMCKKQCNKACIKKCKKAADPNTPAEPNAPKCVSKICKKAAVANSKKAADTKQTK